MHHVGINIEDPLATIWWLGSILFILFGLIYIGNKGNDGEIDELSPDHPCNESKQTKQIRMASKWVKKYRFTFVETHITYKPVHRVCFAIRLEDGREISVYPHREYYLLNNDFKDLVLSYAVLQKYESKFKYIGEE